MTLPKKLEFLTSVRFWKLFAVAVTNLLASEGIISYEIAGAISTVLLGSVVVRTIDRAGEKVGESTNEIVMGTPIKETSVDSTISISGPPNINVRTLHNK